MESAEEAAVMRYMQSSMTQRLLSSASVASSSESLRKSRSGASSGGPITGNASALLSHTPIKGTEGRGGTSSGAQEPGDSEDNVGLLPVRGEPSPVLPLRRLSTSLSQTLARYVEEKEAKATSGTLSHLPRTPQRDSAPLSSSSSSRPPTMSRSLSTTRSGVDSRPGSAEKSNRVLALSGANKLTSSASSVGIAARSTASSLPRHGSHSSIPSLSQQTSARSRPSTSQLSSACTGASQLGMDTRITAEGTAVSGWVDEPDVPLVAAWRPVVSGYILKDADGIVVKKEGFVRHAGAGDAIESLQPLSQLRAHAPSISSADSGTHRGAISVRSFEQDGDVMIASHMPFGAQQPQSISDGGGGNEDEYDNDVVGDASLKLPSFFRPPPTPFVVQLHPGTLRNQFEFHKYA